MHRQKRRYGSAWATATFSPHSLGESRFEALRRSPVDVSRRVSRPEASHKRSAFPLNVPAAQVLCPRRFVSMTQITIAPLTSSTEFRAALSEILVEVVANGGSVSFMHPLPLESADAFWEAALSAAARGQRIVLGASEAETLIGTVSLLLDCPPNQPHRAEIAKLMIRPSHRGRGVAKALVRAAERLAVERARTLLVLDTAADGGASGLYEGLGFTLAGVIPDYALKPHGGLTPTMIYWKRLTE
jgi:ribosomal protein S18 acetylase RimI-like enzyme